MKKKTIVGILAAVMIGGFICFWMWLLSFLIKNDKKTKSEKSRKNLTNAEKLRVSGIRLKEICHS